VPWRRPPSQARPHGGGKEPATDGNTQESTDQDATLDGAREPASARRSTAREHGWIARLAGYCWRYPRNVILALGGTLVVSAVAIAIPLIQRDIVTA
jgi:ATP-binding cassette subfamily B protein